MPFSLLFDIAAAPPGRVEWKDEWPRFSAMEAAATLAATAGSFVVERRLDEPSGPHVVSEVPVIDPGARWLFRGRTKKVQDVFGTYSDIGFRMMAFFPYVVDVGAVALGVHRNPDVAAQMALIDAQALTLAGITQLVVVRAVARQRPYVQDCSPDGHTITRTCGGSNDYKSFFSGHAAAAFTSAGLTCVHHQNIPLYGGGPVEAWACTWAVGVAAATGLFRIVSDAHYATDVLAGAGIGWFYGYVMPKLIHYRNGTRTARAPASLLRWIPSFAPTGDGGFVSVGGAF